MSRSPIPTWYFALAVVRLGHRFLLTREKKYAATWSIPGGRVEPGEPIVTAAIREVYEETGVPIRIDGILRIEHTFSESSVRVRVIFAASPSDDTPPRMTADAESLGAAWLTLDDLRARRARGAELATLLASVEGGRQVFPLDLLATSELAL